MIITKINEAVDILLSQEVLAIFQGSSEIGPRALGNRSFLFDPRNPKAKDIVNKVKKREWYRPTAATVLLEHANTWLKMGSLKESPFMTFAIPVKKKALREVPSIVHVNNTCRVQTLTRKQNKCFYDLINMFYQKTNIPILLNTSFNLAGDPLIETLEDAIDVTKRSDLKYIYTP